MSILKEAYQALQSIVGADWVSDDPAICEADRYCGESGDEKRRPGVSIEPVTTEEVQAIVKIANRYKIPFVATSTYFGHDTFCKKDNSILIDLKRMNQIQIDEDNMYAVVGSGAVFSALQADLWKRGLFTFVPGCGGHSSIVANTINMGDAPLGWRHGLGYQRLLGIEWVLPNGELLKLGSFSMNDDFFWGEGPGPDLRGMLRGCSGHQSQMGIVTRIGVKVFPFVSEPLKPTGVGCHSFLELPENRFKWYNIRFAKREDAFNAMFEIGRCELGLVVMTVPPLFFAIAKSRGAGCGGFWESWNSLGPKINPQNETLRVLLYGIGSEKRLAYEEKVLLDIVAEHNGSARSSACHDETNFMAADAICANVVGGRFASGVAYESINHAVRFGPPANEITDRYKPQIIEDYGTTNWVCPYELGYNGKLEALRMASVENSGALVQWHKDIDKFSAESGAYSNKPDPELFGPIWGNYPQWEDKIKKAFDPNNVSAPA